jgi:hypothetical protein
MTAGLSCNKTDEPARPPSIIGKWRFSCTFAHEYKTIILRRGLLEVSLGKKREIILMLEFINRTKKHIILMYGICILD